MTHRCPTCKARVDAPKLTDSAGFFPFCSERCKLIDLGAWLDAKYTISTPVEQAGDAACQEQAAGCKERQKAKKTL